MDLTNCDREPIHIPGSVQPHGLLFTLTEPDLTLRQVSANAADHVGAAPGDLIGRALSDLLEPPSVAAIRGALASDDPRAASPVRVVARAERGGQHFDAVLHRVEGLAVVELEPAHTPGEVSFGDFYRHVRGALVRLQRGSRVVEICQIAADEVARLTGFDRVMAYRFDRDGHGHVIAESKRADLESYLDLHYPASDIPAQARRLYTLNWLRLIADVAYQPTAIVPPDNPRTGAPLDLSFAVLRSVSPIHVEYLKNMGVHASMSVSLLVEGQLWGLLICHHGAPRFVPYDVRAACEFLGQALSWQAAARERAEAFERRAVTQQNLARLLDRLAGRHDLADALAADPTPLLELVHATGAALRFGGAWTQFGKTPAPADLEALVEPLVARLKDGVFATDSLVEVAPGARYHDALGSGALVVALAPERGDLIVWFRPEVVQTVNWAGDPHKLASLADGDARLTPRGSFALWRETVRSRALPWQPWEVEVAADLRRAIIGHVLTRNAELAGLNARLSSALAELAAGRLEADAQRAMLQALFDGALDAIVVADDTSRYVDANPAACTLLGHSRETLLQMSVVDLVSPDAAALAMDAWQEFLRVGHQRGEVALARPDGSVRTVEFNATASIQPGRHLSILRDVTDRRAAEAERAALHVRERSALAEAELQRQRLRLTFDQAPVAVSVLTAPDQVFEVANPRYEQMVGRTGLVGKTYRAAFPELSPDDPVFALVDRLSVSGETFSADEYHMRLDRRGDGTLEDVYFLFTIQPVCGPEGAVVMVITVAVDVTAQVLARRATEAARAAAEASELQLRVIAETMPQIVWTASPDGAIHYYNSRWFEYTGMTLEQTKGWGWGPVLHPDDLQRCIDVWGESVRTGTPYQIEYRFKRASDRAYRWHLGRALPSLDAAGRVTEWFGTCTDIDDQKRAEYSLGVLAEAGAALMAHHDMEAILQTVTRLAVPALADWSSVYVREETTTRLVALAHMDPHKEALLRVMFDRYGLAEDAPHGYPRVIRDGVADLLAVIDDSTRAKLARDGEHRAMLEQLGAVSAMTVPLTIAGRTFGALTYVASESGRHYGPDDLRLAEELGRRVAVALDNARLFDLMQKERRRAEEANRVKDEFLSVASHELRTPLSAILGWSRLLRAGPLSEAKRERALEAIERNAKIQVKLVEDILDVSRIITGKLRLDVTQIQPLEVAEAALDVVRPAAEAKGVRLQALLDPEAGILHGDSGRLQQILWNLLANAVKFTPKGGRVHLRLQREDSYIEFAVGDTGQGIEPGFLPHVFEPFRQEDGTSTRAHGGLGLGLAIVKHLVELHGGKVEAYSEGLGHGSTFTVHIPIAPTRHSAVMHAEAPLTTPERAGAVSLADLDGLQILVVDDQPDTRELLLAVLTSCKARVTTAGSAKEALGLLRAQLPDVLVSDIGMPGEDGYALIRKVRALPAAQGGRTPAIALTAYARVEDRTRALVEGFTNHVSKPVEPQELCAVIAAAVGRHARGPA